MKESILEAAKGILAKKLDEESENEINESKRLKTVDQFATDMMNNVAHKHWPSYKVIDAWRDFAQSLEDEIKRLKSEKKK